MFRLLEPVLVERCDEFEDKQKRARDQYASHVLRRVITRIHLLGDGRAPNGPAAGASVVHATRRDVGLCDMRCRRTSAAASGACAGTGNSSPAAHNEKPRQTVFSDSPRHQRRGTCPETDYDDGNDESERDDVLDPTRWCDIGGSLPAVATAVRPLGRRHCSTDPTDRAG